jgi:hypothetical protein
MAITMRASGPGQRTVILGRALVDDPRVAPSPAGAIVRTAKIPQGTARHQGPLGLQNVATRRVGRLGSVGLDLLLALPDTPPPIGPGDREASLDLAHSTGIRSLTRPRCSARLRGLHDVSRVPVIPLGAGRYCHKEPPRVGPCPALRIPGEPALRPGARRVVDPGDLRVRSPAREVELYPGEVVELARRVGAGPFSQWASGSASCVRK